MRPRFKSTLSSVPAPEGRVTIENGLEHHGIEVDEVAEHKPPAHAYVDERAVPFVGGWENVIAAIPDFRR